jgi:DNA-binding transcriptional MerR regulator
MKSYCTNDKNDPAHVIEFQTKIRLNLPLQNPALILTKNESPRFFTISSKIPYLTAFMNHFTISDIVNLSGIKAHTLRVWEQRYQILKPKRKESKHRYYDNEDLKEILRIAWLNRHGYKISKIAKMSHKKMKELCSVNVPTPAFIESTLNELMIATQHMDEPAFNQILQSPLLDMGIERTVTQILYPLLERIGRGWITDSTRPVQEHFASEKIKNVLLSAIQKIPVADEGPLTVLFTPEEEHHELPLLFIHYLLKKKDQRIAYLGKNISIDTLQFYLSRTPVDTLQLHMITDMSNQSPDEYIAMLLKTFPEQQIVVSGPVSAKITLANPRLQLLTSFEQQLQFCGYMTDSCL